MAARVAAAMCLVLAVVLVAAAAAVAMAPGKESAGAAQCDGGKLMVCAPAIIGGAAPSASCCSNLQAQQGCFYQYARDQAYAGYINSPTARKAIPSCCISLPQCEADTPSV